MMVLVAMIHIHVHVYATLEPLLIKGCKQEEHRSELDIVKEIYIDDIHFSKFEVEFQTIVSAFKDNISLKAIFQCLESLSEKAMSVYSEIVVLVELNLSCVPLIPLVREASVH